MEKALLYPAGATPACRYAAEALAREGIPVVDHPSPEITHLLLDVPAFGADGMLRDGSAPEELLRRLPEDITVIGGGLGCPALEGYARLDLLESEDYLCANAALTADCALRLAAARLETAFADTPTVIVGWGRIGKCLARILANLGAPVTVAARSPRDRGMLRALGVESLPIEGLPALAGRAGLLINTAPELILDARQTARWRDCLMLDLASRQGLVGGNVLWARGLPGRLVPRSSGALIAREIRKEGIL